jgi:DNA-directed RNA polymerase subunit RPC12/RpoP
MANWMEAVCLKCGGPMDTVPVLVCTEPESWLDDYPVSVRGSIADLESSAHLPYKYHRTTCEECGFEVLVGVRDPYAETKDGRVAVMLGGRYFLVSDEHVPDDELDI